MRKLFTEGLLDPEYFTQTDDQRKAKVRQGLAGAFGRDAHWLDITEEEIWRQYQSIEPMTSQFNSKKIWPAHDVTTLTNLQLPARLKIPKDWYSLATGSSRRKGRSRQTAALRTASGPAALADTSGQQMTKELNAISWCTRKTNMIIIMISVTRLSRRAGSLSIRSRY